MHLYEWLTIVAIISGPIAAIAIQLFFEKRREDRRRKLSLLDILMANRGRMTTLPSVQAFNQIEIVFYDNEDVRSKWAELFNELERARTLTGDELQSCYKKREDLLVELISLIADSLGYKLSHTTLKGRRYNPQAFVDEENYQAAIRKAMLPLISGEKPLTVRLKPESES